MRNPFRYFNSSPDVIRLAVMLYICYPLSLRQVEDLLFEGGIDIVPPLWPSGVNWRPERRRTATFTGRFGFV